MTACTYCFLCRILVIRTKFASECVILGVRLPLAHLLGWVVAFVRKFCIRQYLRLYLCVSGLRGIMCHEDDCVRLKVKLKLSGCNNYRQS